MVFAAKGSIYILIAEGDTFPFEPFEPSEPFEPCHAVASGFMGDTTTLGLCTFCRECASQSKLALSLPIKGLSF